MVVINSYFDFDDYSQPIKTYIDDRFLFNIMFDFTKENIVYIRQNEAETQDGFFYYTPDGSNSEFLSVDRIDQRLYDAEGLVSMKFVKDTRKDSFERSVFSILDVLGNIGGLNEVIEVGGGIIVAIFSGKLFLYSLISSLYQVDTLNKKHEEEEFEKECKIYYRSDDDESDGKY